MTGKFRDALAGFEEAARICRNSGHLSHWASAFGMGISAKRILGLPQWIEDIQTLQDAGADAGHELTLSWAQNFMAYRDIHLGKYDLALVRLDAAGKAAETVGDYRNLAVVLGERGVVLYKLGESGKAFEALERSRLVLQQHHLSGLFVSRPTMCRARVFLWAAEAADDADKGQLLREAGKACEDAMKQGAKVNDDGAPDATRLYGVYEWLRGRPDKAKKRWEAAIASGEHLEANYILGLTHLEVGRRTSDRTHLQRAEELLVSAGAVADLVDVRRSLA